VQQALWRILRFDFRPLSLDFEIYGDRDGGGWRLAFVPRAKQLRQAMDRIVVAGSGNAVQRIELRHSARQYVEIIVSSPRPAATFTADELRRYFR
jgi:hypothetical protein